MLFGPAYTTRKYLGWCFNYLLNDLDHTKNYNWLERFDFSTAISRSDLKSFFYKHGYLLYHKPLENGVKKPGIICLKSSICAILLEHNDHIALIEEPERGREEILIDSNSDLFSQDIFYLEKLHLAFNQKHLSQQILSFAFHRIFSKWYVGCLILSILIIYELFSLIEPILLNLVIEHLDLFGSFIELVLPLLSIAMIILLGVWIGFYRQRFWLMVFGNLALGLSQDTIKQFFGYNIFLKNKTQTHDYFGRMYALEQIFYRTLQLLFFIGFDIVFLIINFFVMCYVNLKLASIDMAFFISMFFLNTSYNKQYYLDSSHVLKVQNDTTQVLLDGLENLNLIKANQLQTVFFDRLNKSKYKYWDAFLRNDWIQNYFEWLMLALKKINWIGMLGLGVYLILNQELSLGAFVGFWALKNLVFSRFELILKRILQWQYLKAPLDRVADIFVNKVNFRSAEVCPPTTVKVSGIMVFALIIRDLKFKTLIFDVNKKYLIKGMSGCGKSSLLNTICGLEPYEGGRIYYEGKACDLDEWQSFNRECVYVSQGESLFKASLLENICLFARSINYAHLDYIIELLDLRIIIDNLPHGIDTHLGESGINLSGGQLQRIYLARALYKKPKWLILDEATCHLDEGAEKKLIEKLARLSISMIVVNHRQGYETYFDEVLDWNPLLEQ